MCDKTPCARLDYIDSDGVKHYKPKKSIKTDKEAIEAARRMNTHDNQIHKCVAYKCPLCHMWHIGRNNSVLTNKDKQHYKIVK